MSHSQDNNSQNIPFLDLVTPHVELEQELTAVFQQVMRSAGFIGGPMVEDFEKEFAAFCHTDYSVAVNSGTDALRFALMAAGVKAGDVVITVPHTFIATTEAISQAGAQPEFVDIDERTYNMDPTKLRELSRNAVHSVRRRQAHQQAKQAASDGDCAGASLRPDGGHGCDSGVGGAVSADRRLRTRARRMEPNIFRGNKIAGSQAGSMGRAAAFSFYPGKIWELAAKAARSPRMTRSIARKPARCCAIMVRRKSITTTSRDTTAVWIRSRPES